MAGSRQQGSGGQAGRAAAIARLLQEESSQLLHFYTERESLPVSAAPGGQLVVLPPLGAALSPAERLCFLHAALSECRRLLDEAVKREDAEFSPEEQYRTQRRTVLDRLDHLLHSTEPLLQDGKRCAASVAEIPDAVDGGVFALKKWILQVLQDIVHWSSQTSEVLQTLPVEKSARRTRRAARRHQPRLRK
ncbi:ciliary neurotrophic factor [Astyanax mexicanus]|uniref:Ciliary neurotrophic factor n=1 Tax=Astyanax mexicanus TaxID=7994 RepID=A0A8T2LY72_ASTMX|nr:ciliary neurotrophic factor [Astyanax mexicanus]